MYLGEPEKGGGTTFPDVHLEVFPKRGHGVFFSYERPHPSTRTLHGGAPVLAVKLQELFGLADTPRVGAGRIPVTLHLLSPAGRPLQVTQDLRSFWEQTYPQVRRELRARYPRHPWPDDPWTAVPTHRAKPRSRR